MSKFSYYTNCVDCPGPDPGDAINELQDSCVGITRKTFMRNVDKDDRKKLEEQLGYFLNHRQGLTMAKDWHPGYYKGKFRGETCYFFDHSRIEYIFLKRN